MAATSLQELLELSHGEIVKLRNSLREENSLYPKLDNARRELFQSLERTRSASGKDQEQLRRSPQLKIQTLLQLVENGDTSTAIESVLSHEGSLHCSKESSNDSEDLIPTNDSSTRKTMSEVEPHSRPFVLRSDVKDCCSLQDTVERLKTVLKAALKSEVFPNNAVVIMKETNNSSAMSEMSDTGFGATLCGPLLRVRKGWYRVDTSEKQSTLFDCIKCIWKISSDSKEAWSLISTAMKDALLLHLSPEDFIDWSLYPVVNIIVRRACQRSLSDSKVTLITEGAVFMSRSHRPETYLQFAGKAILEQFSRKLHGLLALPESVPFYVLELLCLDPFQGVLTQALECILNKKAELSAFYPFLRVQSSIRKFTPLRRHRRKDWGICRSNGKVIKKTVYGMVLNIHKDSLDFLKGVGLLFTDREILLPSEHEQSLHSGILEVWKRHANDLGKLMQKDSKRAVKKLIKAFQQNKDNLLTELHPDCWPTSRLEQASRKEDLEKPRKMSLPLCQLVESISSYLNRSRKLPEPLKIFPCLIAIECVDSIFSLCGELTKKVSIFEPCKAYSMINALLCIKRRLGLLQDVYEITPQTECLFKIVQNASERVLKAEELLSQLKEYIFEMHIYRIRKTCLKPSIQEDWNSWRPSDARHDISPFLRIWRMQLDTIQQEMCELLSSHMQSLLFGKILSEGLGELCIAYMHLTPTKPLLEDFALDAAYILSTVHHFCELMHEQREPELEELNIEIQDCCKALASHASIVLCPTEDLESLLKETKEDTPLDWKWIKEVDEVLFKMDSTSCSSQQRFDTVLILVHQLGLGLMNSTQTRYIGLSRRWEINALPVKMQLNASETKDIRKVKSLLLDSKEDNTKS